MQHKELLKFAKIAATTYKYLKSYRDKFKAQLNRVEIKVDPALWHGLVR